MVVKVIDYKAASHESSEALAHLLIAQTFVGAEDTPAYMIVTDAIASVEKAHEYLVGLKKSPKEGDNGPSSDSRDTQS